MNAHEELRALLELVPAPRTGDPVSAHGGAGVADGRQDLARLAEGATHAREADDAWAGRRDPYATSLTCALCGHVQGTTVPFLSVRCRGCGCSVLPGRCTTCHHVTVVFSAAPDLSSTARCTCGAGTLRPLHRLPAPRSTTVEALLGPVGTGTPLSRRLALGARSALVLVGLLGLLLGVLALRTVLSDGAPAPVPAPAADVLPAGASAQDLGRAAAQQLLQDGRVVNAFSCRAAAAAQAVPELDAFLGGCAEG